MEHLQEDRKHFGFPNQQELKPGTFVKCVKGIQSIPALVKTKP